MLNGKAMTIHLIVGLILHKMIQYLPNPYKLFGGNIKIESDLSSYASKAELKQLRGVDTSKLAAKSDLASLKAEIDQLDVDKSKTISADLSKPSNAINIDKLVAKLNNIETSGFVLTPKYTLDKLDLVKKIIDTENKYLILTDLLKKQIIMLKLQI